MAAEMSTGVLAMAELYKTDPAGLHARHPDRSHL